MSRHVVLPDEREAQLRAIAVAHNVTVADAVGLLIKWAIDAGKVPAGIPGIEVQRTAEGIVLNFGDFERTLSLELAQAYATTLRWFATPKADGIPFAVTSLAQALSGAHLVGITRRGTSVKVAGLNGEGERTLAPSIARELADIIEHTAASGPL
jgi:hypothetical protein